MRSGRWFGALTEGNFRLYFIGQLTSAIGTGMSPVALSFAVLETHRSASDVGYVLAAGTVPLALFLLTGGVVADRLGKRRVMLGADVLRGTAQAALGALVLVGHPPLWGFLVLSALVGTGMAFFMPSIAGLIPAVVRTEHLPQANALNGLTFSLGEMIGPAIAGAVVATTNPGWAVVADAASYFVSVGTLLAMRVGPLEAGEGESFVHQLREGWREFRSRTWLWVIVVQWSIGNMLFLGPYFVLGAVISKRSLGGAAAWGTILAVQGIGSVLGGVAMLRLRPARPLLVAVLSGLTFPWVLLSLGFGAPLAVIAAGAGFAGVSIAVFAAIWDTTFQREVPQDVISRVSAYDWFGSLVFLPVGFAIAGPVAAAIGMRTTFLVSSIYCVGSISVVACVPAVRRLHWKDPVAGQVSSGTDAAGTPASGGGTP